MRWVQKEQNSHFKSFTSITRASRSDAPWHAAETSTHQNAHARSGLRVRKTSPPLIFLQMAKKGVACDAWPLAHADNQPQCVKCVFKRPGIIVMWQRLLISSGCYRRTCTRSYFKLPSFSIIGESQNAVEDNNLSSVNILPTLVCLHKLSVSCINQELNPWGCGINQQTLARSLHFSDNEDSFIIISHPA